MSDAHWDKKVKTENLEQFNLIMIEHKILHKKLSVKTQENNRKSELVLKIFFFF